MPLDKLSGIVIPNLLTILRFLLGLAFPWVPPEWRLAACAFAGFSDLVDGEISRRFHSSSLFGKMLDPVADKTFVLAVIGTLLFEGELTWWQLALVGARDLVVLFILGWVLLGDWRRVGEMSPRVSGKVATAGQFAFLLGVLIARSVHPWLLAVASLLSAVAAVDYFAVFLQKRRDGHPRAEETGSGE
jgi:cardiolipin synthase (CMP-forming)